MEEYWMIIGLILTGCVILLTYYLAVVLKELAERLRESKSVVANLDQITNNVLENQQKIQTAFDKIENVAINVEEAILMLKDQILLPFTYVLNIVQRIQEHFNSKQEDSDN